VGYGFKNKPEISWFAQSPYPKPDPQQRNRVMNGFLMMTLDQTSISETFYNQDGAVAFQCKWP